MPQNIALYYPYIHFKDEAWLKQAALYWPRLARIVPDHYPTRDSRAVQLLRDELDAIDDLVPDFDALARVSDRFIRLVATHSPELRHRCSLKGLDTGIDPEAHLSEGRGGLNPLYRQGKVAYVYASKMSYALCHALEEAGLSSPGRGDLWVGMHPDLARAYMCALTEELSILHGLHPATDQPDAFIATGSWDMDRIASVLLGEPSWRESDVSLHERFVVACLRQAVPVDLEHVPMERIVAARKSAGHLLNDFRLYVEQGLEDFAAAHSAQDTVLAADVLAEVELTVGSKLKVLERELRKAKLDTAPSLLSVKTALPALPLAAANLAHLPPQVQGGLAVAAGVAWVARGMSASTTHIVESSPVGYLHSVNTTINADTAAKRLVRRFWD